MHDRIDHARLLDRAKRREDAAAWTARGSRGLVVSAHYLATAAGVAALEQGGTAADAAVATSLALAVCESAGSGLGGMAIALVRDSSGRVRVVPGACRAPAGATPDAVAAARSRYRGHASVAVPTCVAVLAHLHRSRGRLPLAQLVEPARRLAQDGYPLTPTQCQLLSEYGRRLRRAGAGRLFLRPDGGVPAVGSRFRQPELAETLGELATEGLESFYSGRIARGLDSDMRAHGGFVRLRDLEAACRVEEVEPIRGRSWDDEVLSAGPPAGGLALLQMLEIASRVPALAAVPGSPPWVRAVAATIRRARTDRRLYRLRTGAEELGEALELLGPERAGAAADQIIASTGGGETSHLIAVDAAGSLVSMTQSIERSFGAGVLAGDLGFLYNGYLRAFKLRNRKHPHYLRAGAPARSNAAPVLLLRKGRPRATLGSTGSERMLSGMFQVLLRLRHQEPFAAVAAPRLHATPDGHVLWEAERFPPEAGPALLDAGYRLEELDAWSFKAGGLQLAVFDDDGSVTGVSEPRRDGSVAGPGGVPLA